MLHQQETGEFVDLKIWKLFRLPCKQSDFFHDDTGTRVLIFKELLSSC